jgi:hypothetical protein
MNNKGQNIDPCGTPDTTLAFEETLLPTGT